MSVRNAVTGLVTRAINPFWEDLLELRWFQACRRFSRALATLVPDSARLRRCDGRMRRAVERACAASDRHSLGFLKPRRLAINRAASIVGRALGAVGGELPIPVFAAARVGLESV